MQKPETIKVTLKVERRPPGVDSYSYGEPLVDLTFESGTAQAAADSLPALAHAASRDIEERLARGDFRDLPTETDREDIDQ